MIEKITPDHILGLDGLPTTIMPDSAKLMKKINELVDAVNRLQLTKDVMFGHIDRLNDTVNELHAEAESNARTRADHEHKIEKLQAKDEEIEEWIAIVSDLRSRVPVVESRVSILEEHAHPTAKTPVDPYEKQRNWISKLCRFRDKHSDVWKYGTLEAVEDVDHAIDCAFRSSDGYWYDICEPVKPDDDIIYKGGNNE